MRATPRARIRAGEDRNPCYVACVHDKSRVAAILREIRARAGLSQEAIGLLAGVNRSTVNRWMNEHSRPELDQGLDAVRRHRPRPPRAHRPGSRAFRGPPAYAGPASCPDTRPAIVRDNWQHETVRTIWQNGLAEADRLEMVSFYLAILTRSAGKEADVRDITRGNS